MTHQATSGGEDRARVRALLWITSTRDGTVLAAPAMFGGQQLKEQERTVREHAKQHDLSLTDHDLFLAHVATTDPAPDRLGQLVSFVVKYPTVELYVPESVFADLRPADVKMYIATLYVHDVDLFFCRDA